MKNEKLLTIKELVLKNREIRKEKTKSRKSRILIFQTKMEKFK